MLVHRRVVDFDVGHRVGRPGGGRGDPRRDRRWLFALFGGQPRPAHRRAPRRGGGVCEGGRVDMPESLAAVVSAVAILLLTFNRNAQRLLLIFNRSAADERQSRSPVRHPRPDGAEDPRGPRPAPRLRHRAADRAGHRRRPVAQPGHHLSGAAAARAEGLGQEQLGHQREQPAARFYAITPAGRKQLGAEQDSWARTVAMVGRLLEQE